MKLTIGAIASTVFLIGSTALLAQAPAQPQQPEFVKQGQQLMRDGKPEEALALYRQTLQTSPDSLAANLAAGSTLDLMGKSEEARKYFTKAIEVADTPESKKRQPAEQWRCPTLSRAIARRPLNTNNRSSTSTAVRRISFSKGRPQTKWLGFASTLAIWTPPTSGIRLATTPGLKNPTSSRPVKIYGTSGGSMLKLASPARRGDQAEAQKHVAAAKAILDKGAIPEQAQFFPYLKGYVAFYAGDYNVALAELEQGNANDPFIQCMIGQTYEKLGEKDKALEYYRKAAAATSHNPAAAYAVPLAKKKLSS
jgi:tetratricopeptide (TPR) repeat protein